MKARLSVLVLLGVALASAGVALGGDAKAELKKSQGPNFAYRAMVGDRKPPLDYRKASASAE